jgi:hypothetical protein
MLKYFCSFFKSLEQWEKYQPSSFWLCSIGLYIFFSAGFGALFPESPRQSQVVIEQIRGGGTGDSGSSTSSAYVPPGRTTPRQTNPGTQDKTIKSSPKEYEPKPGIRLGAGGDPGDSGSGSGTSSWEEDNLIPPKEIWKDDPDYWADYKSNREDFKKKKKLEEETCSISDELQNKADIDDLPDSCNGKYVFDISNKKAKQKVRKLWTDKNFKNTATNMLGSIDSGTRITQENLEGFNTLKRYKKGDVRIIVVRSKGNEPEKIIAIIPRKDLEDLLKVFKKKYD